MKKVLENIDYKNIFKYFEEISEIPRGSGDNKRISDYLVRFAIDRGLRYVQDEALNVIIYKEATKGMEHVSPVIIQGHMDMVCEKDEDSKHDFEKDGIELIVEDEYVTANKTTLGADDGIGVAYALALLDDETLVHPPLEILITTDEETGMDGAEALDSSLLKGKYLINLDSEDEGVILSSCAGGLTADCVMPIERTPKAGLVIDIEVNGLKGGHSGTEIVNKGLNATITLSRVLYYCMRNIEMNLVDMHGGQKDNVIPNHAKASILIDEKDKDRLVANLNEIKEQIIRENQISDPGVAISITKEEKKEINILTLKSTLDVLKCLQLIPNGVQVMSSMVNGLPESSLNLGIMKLTDSQLVTSHSVRSSVNEYKKYIFEKISMIFGVFGGSATLRSEYPAWEYNNNSYLRQLCQDTFRAMYGKEAKIEAIHAGLECGILSGKIKDLDIVSFGPDMQDIHTSKERLHIESTKRVYDFIVRILSSFK